MERNQEAIDRLTASLGPGWAEVAAAMREALHREPTVEAPKSEAEIAREEALRAELDRIAREYPDRFAGLRR
ncbi:MAG: hypothetical protein ACYDD0_00885 [Candidatus Dormibacteria bacterium]